MTPFYSVGEKNLWLDTASASGGGGDNLWDSVAAVALFDSTPFTFANPDNSAHALSGGNTDQQTTTTMFSSAGSLETDQADTSSGVYDANQLAVTYFGTGAWTIEGWVYCTTFSPPAGRGQAVLTNIQYQGGGTPIGWYVGFASGGAYLQLAENSTTWQSWSFGSTSINTWHYIAIASSGTESTGTATLSGYVTTLGNSTASRNLNSTYTLTLPSSNASSRLGFGCQPDVGFAVQDNQLQGYCDSIRIVKGVDRFENASSIDVPDAQFPTS